MQAHTAANAAYLAAEVAAKAEVARLVTAAGGTDASASTLATLTAKKADTTAAEGAVATQRGRVESLIEAKRTQDLEEARWTERVAAANTAEGLALTAKTDATAAVATAKEQVSTRSWLFEVLGEIKVTDYAANCNSGSNPVCALSETAKDASTSTWAWPSAGNCNYVVGSGLSAVTHNCLIKGLTGPSSAGLTQAATASKGTARVTGAGAAAPTELYLAFEGADYDYVSSSTQLSGADSSKMLIALDNYLAW
jgi:hypothetical protein